MTEVTPVRIGLLIDYLDENNGYDENVLPTLQLVADDFTRRAVLQRPVEFVIRAVQGLPNGSFRAVRDAFYELVDEDALVIFGPWVSENGVPLRRHVEDLAQVPIITMAASESMLGEWVFGLPAGSMEEEPIIMATVAALDGCRSVGLAFEDSLIGREYLRSTRDACRNAGLAITAEVPIPQVESDKRAAMAVLAADKPDAVMHVGFGLGIIGMNAALQAIGWMPPRYTTTAFEFAATGPWWREQLAGWIGLDQYDERNQTGREFLDRFEQTYRRRPAYFFPLYAYDIGRLMMTALATARPLTGPGVKDALERIKMLPAASGAPAPGCGSAGTSGTVGSAANSWSPDGFSRTPARRCCTPPSRARCRRRPHRDRPASGREFSCDGRVVVVDLGGVHRPKEGIRQGRMLVGLDRHGAGEQRDVVGRPGEVVLHRDTARHSAVAGTVMPESADRIEDPERRPHCDGELPGEDPVAVGAGLGPGVAHFQRQSAGQVFDLGTTGIGLRPVGRVGDEVVNRLGEIAERCLRTGGDDAQRCAFLFCDYSAARNAATVSRSSSAATARSSPASAMASSCMPPMPAVIAVAV